MHLVAEQVKTLSGLLYCIEYVNFSVSYLWCNLLISLQVADLKTYLYTKGHVSPGAPNDRASGDEGPAHDIIKPLPASSEATNSQESNQTAPTTWKKHPLPWMQHFYVPATYDGRTDHATALGW